MTHSEDYQTFIQKLQRDIALLDKQYKAFEELKRSLETLREAAPHDPSAARSLEKVNALNNDNNFKSLCAEAEKNLRTISRQIDSLDKQLFQAESTQIVPSVACETTKGMRQDTQSNHTRRKRQFV